MSTLLVQPAAATKVGTRIPTLDGWRGVAILLVLVAHFGPIASKQDLFGQHGVTIFFVLSGFLITTKLREEESRNGRINLASFYVRRFFRLMPCAWIFLAVMSLLASVGRREILASIFFYRNEIKGSWLTLHFWSLSLEEQFYLAWPLVLLAKKHAAWIAGIGAVCISLYRFVRWDHYSAYPLFFRTEVRADALLVGCFLALVWQHPLLPRIANRFTVAPLLLLFAVCVFHFHDLVPLCECVVIALLIASGLADQSPLAPVLNFPPLRMVGMLSYSIYVWQQPFFFVMRHQAHKLPTFLLLIPVAVVSYYGIERPLTNFGRRFLCSAPS
jgi:peptidoglycan/LPS O-acetylase OafA/YrhL